jgi:hypothetical protein
VRIALTTAIALVLVVPADLAIEALARQALAVLRRFVRDAGRVYVRVAVVALVLSWVPDVALLVIHDARATVPAVASLMVRHAATAVICVTLLVQLSRAQ